jgi:hypothetical protein
MDLSEQRRVVHTVLGLFLLVYSGLGLASTEFFAVLSQDSGGIEWRNPVAWLMLAAMSCGVAVVAAIRTEGEEACARSRLHREFALTFQSMGWVLFFAAALLYVHDNVLASVHMAAI